MSLVPDDTFALTAAPYDVNAPENRAVKDARMLELARRHNLQKAAKKKAAPAPAPAPAFHGEPSSATAAIGDSLAALIGPADTVARRSPRSSPPRLQPSPVPIGSPLGELLCPAQTSVNGISSSTSAGSHEDGRRPRQSPSQPSLLEHAAPRHHLHHRVAFDHHYDHDQDQPTQAQQAMASSSRDLSRAGTPAWTTTSRPLSRTHI